MEREEVVVTGVNGFIGHHLTRELNKKGLSIIGIERGPNTDAEISDIVSDYHPVDLTEKWPDLPNVKAVIHLAGLAAVGPSFDEPQKYIETNSSMVTNMCEYYLKQDVKPRIVIVSSGAIYDPKQSMPINEDGKIGFASPYAISKVLAENQATYYRNRGLDCVVARLFNQLGPGQNAGFILPDFYDRLSSLQKDEYTISTGNIETCRDYTDVRDTVHALGLIALAQILKYDTYNICSGISLSGIEIFNELKDVMNLPNVEYKIDQPLRPNDAKNIVGDNSRLKNELNWKPEIDINQTIIDFVKSKSL